MHPGLTCFKDGIREIPIESIPGILETGTLLLHSRHQVEPCSTIEPLSSSGWEPPAQDKSRSTRNSDEKADLEHLHNVMKTILNACRCQTISRVITSFVSPLVSLFTWLDKLIVHLFSGITLAPGRSWTRWIEKQCLTTMSMSSSPWTWRPWQRGWRPTTMWTKGSSLQTWKGCSQTAGQLCNLYWIEFTASLECFVDETNLQGLQRSRDWILQQC